MSMKIIGFCTVLYILQFSPCQSKLIGRLFNIPKGFVGGFQRATSNCPTPDKNVCPYSNIHYYLYTRDTQDFPYKLDPLQPQTIRDAKFIAGAPLKVIIHGYTGHRDFSPNIELRPAYFQKGEYNIITVDWGALAPYPCYVQAAENVPLVAKCTAEFLDLLYESCPELSLKNSHVLGFSLGAHVAGILGNNLKTGTMPRITGFDPAFPLFDKLTTSEDKRINPSAGQFVDIYHSNVGYRGKRSPCGHVDVYLNNGIWQPGCDCDGSCDHDRAVIYFAEAINSPVGLWGFPCASWDSYVGGACKAEQINKLEELGESLSTSMEHGNYLAFTNEAPPYLLDRSAYLEDSKDLINKVDKKCNRLTYVFSF